MSVCFWKLMWRKVTWKGNIERQRKRNHKEALNSYEIVKKGVVAWVRKGLYLRAPDRRKEMR